MENMEPKAPKLISASRIFVLLICLAVITVSSTAQKRNNFRDLAVSDDSSSSLFAPTPILLSGNPSCADLNASSNPAFAHITSDNELRLDFEPPTGNSGPYTFTNGNGKILVGTPDPNNSVSLQNVNQDVNTFSFTSTRTISAVIVKGGPDSNVYPYPSGTNGDTGLTTPNAGPAISHISFCFEPRVGPTAASVPVAGRVMTSKRGLFSAIVYMTDQNGETKTALTNSFGYYRFEGVTVGETYTMNVFSKRHMFAPQIVTINEEMTDLNFVAEP